jgi:hypothetical protein
MPRTTSRTRPASPSPLPPLCRIPQRPYASSMSPTPHPTPEPPLRMPHALGTASRRHFCPTHLPWHQLPPPHLLHPPVGSSPDSPTSPAHSLHSQRVPQLPGVSCDPSSLRDVSHQPPPPLCHLLLPGSHNQRNAACRLRGRDSQHTDHLATAPATEPTQSLIIELVTITQSLLDTLHCFADTYLVPPTHLCPMCTLWGGGDAVPASDCVSTSGTPSLSH